MIHNREVSRLRKENEKKKNGRPPLPPELRATSRIQVRIPDAEFHEMSAELYPTPLPIWARDVIRRAFTARKERRIRVGLRREKPTAA